MSQNPSVREWWVGPHPETGEVDPEEVAQMAVDVSTVMRMVGGTATWGAHRDQDPETGEWLTLAIWCRWHPFAPGAIEQDERPAQQPQAQSNGGGQRKRRNRGRGRGRGGGGQPPQAPAQAQQAPAPGFFENQPEPEPQEPPEAFGDEEQRPPDEFLPLTPEQEAELREEGLVP
jgi:hypothetical protein